MSKSLRILIPVAAVSVSVALFVLAWQMDWLDLSELAETPAATPVPTPVEPTPEPEPPAAPTPTPVPAAPEPPAREVVAQDCDRAPDANLGSLPEGQWGMVRARVVAVDAEWLTVDAFPSGALPTGQGLKYIGTAYSLPFSADSVHRDNPASYLMADDDVLLCMRVPDGAPVADDGRALWELGRIEAVGTCAADGCRWNGPLDECFVAEMSGSEPGLVPDSPADLRAGLLEPQRFTRYHHVSLPDRGPSPTPAEGGMVLHGMRIGAGPAVSYAWIRVSPVASDRLDYIVDDTCSVDMQQALTPELVGRLLGRNDVTTAGGDSPVSQAPATPQEPAVDGPVNIRSGPGTDYPVMGRVPTGPLPTFAGRNADGSWLLLAEGGWVSAGLMRGAVIASLPVAQAPPPPEAPSAPAAPEPTPAPEPEPTPTPAVPPLVGHAIPGGPHVDAASVLKRLAGIEWAASTWGTAADFNAAGLPNPLGRALASGHRVGILKVRVQNASARVYALPHGTLNDAPGGVWLPVTAILAGSDGAELHALGVYCGANAVLYPGDAAACSAVWDLPPGFEPRQARLDVSAAHCPAELCTR